MTERDGDMLLHRLNMAVITAATVATYLQTVELACDTIAALIPDVSIEKDCIEFRDTAHRAITEAMKQQAYLDQLLAAAITIIETGE